jgi:hypothetical protein
VHELSRLADYLGLPIDGDVDEVMQELDRDSSGKVMPSPYLIYSAPSYRGVPCQAETGGGYICIYIYIYISVPQREMNPGVGSTLFRRVVN